MKDDRNAMELQNHKIPHNSLPYSSVQQRGQNGLLWRNAWTRVCFCLQLFSFLFSSLPMIFAVRVCHPSPGSRWSPLSWQTLEVSQADTNIEHHPQHIAQNFLVKGHDLIFFGPHYIWAIFYWAPTNFVFVVCCSCTGISQEGRGNDDDWDNFIINISSRPKNAHWHSRRHKEWKHHTKIVIAHLLQSANMRSPQNKVIDDRHYITLRENITHSLHDMMFAAVSSVSQRSSWDNYHLYGTLLHCFMSGS